MTTLHDLPALPVHKGFLYLHGAASVSQVFGYTAGQMEAYARAAIDHALARSGAEAVAWVVSDGQDARWRMWGDSGPEWTTDREKALRFARRDDAEAFARDDEDAWHIKPYYTAPPAAAGVPEGYVPAHELRAFYKHHVNTLESARDEIVRLGGECDAVEVMEHRDPVLKRVRDMLAAAPQPSDVVTIADIQPPAIDDPKVLETMEVGVAAMAGGEK